MESVERMEERPFGPCEKIRLAIAVALCGFFLTQPEVLASPTQYFDTVVFGKGAANSPLLLQYGIGEYSKLVQLTVLNNTNGPITPVASWTNNPLAATVSGSCGTLRPGGSCALSLTLPAPVVGTLSGATLSLVDSASQATVQAVIDLLGTPPVCPRNPIGGQLQDSVHVYSSNGVFEDDFYYVTNTDGNGNQVAMGETQMPYYCFLTRYGEPAPIPHVNPGDQFIVHYHDLLPISMDQTVPGIPVYSSALGYYVDYVDQTINALVNLYNATLAQVNLGAAQGGQYLQLLAPQSTTGSVTGLIGELLFGPPYTGPTSSFTCPGTMPGPYGNMFNPGGYYPTTMNVHFHGFNTTPTCGGDQVVYTVFSAGETFTYNLLVPTGEPPGIYAYHPHIHGLANDEMQGGASGMIIVEGIENFNPAVLGLPERFFFFRDQVYADSTNFIGGACTPGTAAGPGNQPPSCPDGSTAPTWNLSVNYTPLPYDLDSSVYDYGPDIARMDAQSQPVLFVPYIASPPANYPGFSYTGPDAVGNNITKLSHYPTPYFYMRPSLPGQPPYQEYWRFANFAGDAFTNIEVRVNGVPQPLQIVELDGVPANSQDAEQLGSTLTTLPNGQPIIHYQLSLAARIGIIVTAPTVAPGQKPPRMEIYSTAYDAGPAGDNHPARPLAQVVLTPSAPPPAIQLPSVASNPAPSHQFQGLPDSTAPVDPNIVAACAGFQQASCIATPDCSWIPVGPNWGWCVASGVNHTMFFGETVATNALTGGNPDFWVGADMEALGMGNPSTDFTVPGGFTVQTFSPPLTGVQTTNLPFSGNITKLPLAAISKQGTVEEWVIENHTNETHVFHIHQIHYLLESFANFSSAEDANVDPVTGMPENQIITGQMYDSIAIPGWQESVNGSPGVPCEPETNPAVIAAQGGDACKWDIDEEHIPLGYAYPRVHVRMDFRGGDGVNGLLVLHCHFLGHEDYGMMRLFAIAQ